MIRKFGHDVFFSCSVGCRCAMVRWLYSFISDALFISLLKQLYVTITYCSAPTTKRKVLFRHYVTVIPARWRVWQSHGWSQVWSLVGDPSAREFPTCSACQVISLRCHLHKLRFSACILVGCCNLLLATTVSRLYPLKLRCSLRHYNFLRLLSSDTLVAKCLSVSFGRGFAVLDYKVNTTAWYLCKCLTYSDGRACCVHC